MANKTTTIKASEKTAQVLKIMKELKDLRRENIILKFKNDELTKQLNLCGVVKSFYCKDEENKLAKKCNHQCEICMLLDSDVQQ